LTVMFNGGMILSGPWGVRRSSWTLAGRVERGRSKRAISGKRAGFTPSCYAPLTRLFRLRASPLTTPPPSLISRGQICGGGCASIPEAEVRDNRPSCIVPKLANHRLCVDLGSSCRPCSATSFRNFQSKTALRTLNCSLPFGFRSFASERAESTGELLESPDTYRHGNGALEAEPINRASWCANPSRFSARMATRRGRAKFGPARARVTQSARA